VPTDLAPKQWPLYRTKTLNKLLRWLCQFSLAVAGLKRMALSLGT
jgi:hypothetical protein